MRLDGEVAAPVQSPGGSVVRYTRGLPGSPPQKVPVGKFRFSARSSFVSGPGFLFVELARRWTVVDFDVCVMQRTGGRLQFERLHVSRRPVGQRYHERPKDVRTS